MITIERNGKQIHSDTHPSIGLQYSAVIHEVKNDPDGGWLWSHIKGEVQWCWLFDDREQFKIKLRIFGHAHIARIIDNQENKFDIWIKR